MTNKQIEMIGYAASVALVVSFAIDDFVTFRIVNSIGALLFIIYGILKKALPVTITNLFVLGLNLFYIAKHLWFG
jgi:uncharacterized protein with PQ loop repeat